MRSTRWSRMAAGSWDQPASGALLTKDEPSQLIAQLLDLFRIIGRAEAFGQLEECLFFLLAGLDSLLDKFHQDAVIAEIAFPSQGFNLFRDFGRQGYASPDIFRADGFYASSFGQCHNSTSIHHCGGYRCLPLHTEPRSHARSSGS